MAASKRRGNEVKRNYYIIIVNCDCGAYIMAKTSAKWMYGPRCKLCNKVLGPMEYEVAKCTVRAAGDLDAVRKYKAGV